MTGQLLLARGHVDLVVVQRVQGRRGRRRHPRTRGAGLRVADLGLEHRRHLVRGGPHALADLGLAGQAALEPDVDVLVLVRRDPRRRLHVALADHRPGLHRGVHLVAGAVEEAGVDERRAGRCAAAMHALRFADVRRSSSMIPSLMVPRSSPKRSSTRANRSSVNATSSGPCIFGFTAYIEPARELRQLAAPLEVDEAAQRGHDRVEDPLGDLRPVGEEHRVGGHQQADLAHEEQRPPRQGDARPSGRCRSGPARGRRVNVLPPLLTSAVSVPRISSSQVR